MKLTPVEAHYPPEPVQEHVATVEELLRWYFREDKKLVWDRLLKYSYNNDVLLDLDFHIKYKQDSATEANFPGMDEIQRNTAIRDGFCSMMCTERIRINEYMKKVYDCLTDALEIQNPEPLEDWAFFSDMPDYSPIDLGTLMSCVDDWLFDYEMRDLLKTVIIVLEEFEANKNSGKYVSVQPSVILERILLKMYTINPEVLRNYEKIIRLAISQIVTDYK